MSSPLSGVERLTAPALGPGVCARCLNLTWGFPGLCRACRAIEHHLAAVLPAAYSVGGEWLHHVIVSYKRDADPSVPDAVRMLSELCDGFVSRHERCLAAASGAPEFTLVTTVPSGDPLRDLHHPLRRIVGELVAATRDRYERLLVRSLSPTVPRTFDRGRYHATRRLDGEAVLLIDDMWTSGASAESAARVLLDAGAGTVGAIVLARHLNRGWHQNDMRLRHLAGGGFDLTACALCRSNGPSKTRPAAAQRGGSGSRYDA